MQHTKSANTNIKISEARDLNYTFFRILNSNKTWRVISNSTFCIIFWNKVLVPESQQIELSRKHCHALMLVPNRGLTSGVYHQNTRYESLYIFYWLFFSNNKWFKKFTKKSGRVVIKVYPPDTYWNLNSAVCRKTENGLDVLFSQQVSIHGPPVDFLYVRNESLRITNNYFYWKSDVHQLIFLPVDLG